jgi:hypothetical protein
VRSHVGNHLLTLGPQFGEQRRTVLCEVVRAFVVGAPDALLEALAGKGGLLVGVLVLVELRGRLGRVGAEVVSLTDGVSCGLDGRRGTAFGVSASVSAEVAAARFWLCRSSPAWAGRFVLGVIGRSTS